METTRRTRFAPSPTGYMHIGNLRSALYAWLVSKSRDGKFILRIEDTDQKRQVEGAVEVIYDTLASCHLDHDEGPDVGGPCGPYVQSERREIYQKYAQELLDRGEAYPCFCSKERLAQLEAEGQQGYDRHCREIPAPEARARMAAGEPYVIRQKMPLTGEAHFSDLVFGDITIENSELEDQILIKGDGFPTYNFANVIDDHLMGITHVVRGVEYLSSTPKYNHLYEAFGWEIPQYIHLPLILGTDGKKLSKRHGATSFQDLLQEGYLEEAIVNYIAFLGWSPGQDTREIFSLEELREVFDEKHINKSPAVFDYQKLDWYNAHYLQELSPAEFTKWLKPTTDRLFGEQSYDFPLLAEILQSRVKNRKELPDMLAFFRQLPEYDKEIFVNKKKKLSPEFAAELLPLVRQTLQDLETFDRQSIYEALIDLADRHGWKKGQVMEPPRLAVSGLKVTPGGGIELMAILGKKESLRRLEHAEKILAE